MSQEIADRTKRDETHQYVTIAHDPARGHRHFVLALARPEVMELAIRHRPPVHPELLHLDDPRRRLVVPPELMLQHIVRELGGEVIGFGVVVAHDDASGPEGGEGGGGERGGIPLLCEGCPGRQGEPRGRERAPAGFLNEHVKKRLIWTLTPKVH